MFIFLFNHRLLTTGFVGWGKHDSGPEFNKLTRLGYQRDLGVKNIISQAVDADEDATNDLDMITRAFANQLTKKEKEKFDMESLVVDEYNMKETIYGVLNKFGYYDIVGKEIICADLKMKDWMDCENNAGKFIEQGMRTNKSINCWLLKDGSYAIKKGGQQADILTELYNKPTTTVQVTDERIAGEDSDEDYTEVKKKAATLSTTEKQVTGRKRK